ncbi:MAG: hypothetical protein GY723_14645 [bacterium]|nr:hypothetical protein [bacterium]MCP5071017.1 hypothetical protein [bacterium]
MPHHTRALLRLACALALLAGLVASTTNAADEVKKKRGRAKAVAVPEGRPAAQVAPPSGIGEPPAVAPEIGHEGDRSVRPLPPAIRPGVAPQRTIGEMGSGEISTTPNPGAESRTNLTGAELILPPAIVGTGFAPDGHIGNVFGKIFAPGGLVVIFGKNFGDEEGRVILYVTGSVFPEWGNQIPLEIELWTDTQVNARIPKPMTGPIHRATSPVHLTTAKGFKVVHSGHFEVPTEKKVLSWKDTAHVRVLDCGDRVDFNKCAPPHSKDLPTFWGKHESFDAGNSAEDVLQITLDDGWVFSRVKRFHKYTDEDSTLSDLIPEIEAGETEWTGRVRWGVFGEQTVKYEIEVEVKRARGAY